MWWTDLLQDLTFAIRTIRRQPGFTIAAVVSAALGIGACSLIFGLVNSALFRPLPVQRSIQPGQPDRPATRQRQARRNRCRTPTSPTCGRRRPSRASPRFSRSRPPPLPVTASRSAIGARSPRANYFDVVRPRFAAGRGFDAAKDDRPGEAAGRGAELSVVARQVQRRPGHRRPADRLERPSRHRRRRHRAWIPRHRADVLLRFLAALLDRRPRRRGHDGGAFPGPRRSVARWPSDGCATTRACGTRPPKSTSSARACARSSRPTASAPFTSSAPARSTRASARWSSCSS